MQREMEYEVVLKGNVGARREEKKSERKREGEKSTEVERGGRQRAASSEEWGQR